MSKGCAAPHGQRGTGAGSGLGLQQSREGRPAAPACPWCPPWAFPAGSVISAMPRMCALLGGLLSPLGPSGAPWQLHGCRISQQGWGSCCRPCPRSAALVSLCPGYSETRFPGSRSQLPDVPPQAAAQTWKQQIPLFSPGLSQAMLPALLLVLACLLHRRAGALRTQPWPRRVLSPRCPPWGPAGPGWGGLSPPASGWERAAWQHGALLGTGSVCREQPPCMQAAPQPAVGWAHPKQDREHPHLPVPASGERTEAHSLVLRLLLFNTVHF